MTMSIWEGKGISDRFLPKLPPPPHNVHINKNININNIGICLKVKFSSQKSEMLKFIVLDDQHCLNDILLKPASEQNWIKRMIGKILALCKGGQSYSVINDVLVRIFGHWKDSFGQAVKKKKTV